jgi:hypothetical protein
VLNEKVTADDDDEENDGLDSCGEEASYEVEGGRLMNTTAIAGKMTKLGARQIPFANAVNFTLTITESPSTADCRISIGNA